MIVRPCPGSFAPRSAYQLTRCSIQRRQARQRRDYLYRRAVQLKEAETTEKRAKLRDALASGKPLDPSIAGDKALRKDYQYDESRDVNGEEGMDLDDEYSATSGLVEPRILVTTSRSPSSRLQTFAKEIRLLFPTSVRLNRGTLILPDLVKSCQSNGLSDIVLLHEHRGTPSALTIGTNFPFASQYKPGNVVKPGGFHLSHYAGTNQAKSRVFPFRKRRMTRITRH